MRQQSFRLVSVIGVPLQQALQYGGTSDPLPRAYVVMMHHDVNQLQQAVLRVVAQFGILPLTLARARALKSGQEHEQE